MVESPRSVLAVVLTHDAPESLARCLSRIDAQTRPPDSMLVVDNASDPPAVLPLSPLSVKLLRSEHNGGPAGGHAIGLSAFLESGFDLAWVMDDDCLPAPTCLEELLAASAEGVGADERDDSVFGIRRTAGGHHDECDAPVFPLWVDGLTGVSRFMPAWCGFLMPRLVVERIGLPRVDLVWWTEDAEYLQERLRRAHIMPIKAERAVVEHHRVRTGASKPVWKFYYEARNTIEYRYFVQDRTWRRMGRMTRTIVRLVGRIVLHEPGKAARLRAVVDGISDGIRRRSGLRYPLTSKV